MKHSSGDRGAKLLLALGTCAVVAAYWPGLDGAFLLDDPENFVQLQRYSEGQIGWIGPIVSNGSGPLGRPISMASFVASVTAGGYSPWVLKVGNLMLHATIGALVGLLAVLILRRDQSLCRQASLVGAVIAVTWLALPIHASTVLYAVQRMAQLSTLFMLLGLIGYLWLREHLERKSRGAWFTLIALGLHVGVFTTLAAFSKENGLLLPLLCAVLEFTCFSAPTPARKAASSVCALALVIPVVGVVLLLLVAPEKLLAGYETRSFTAWERLLTQPRVLWDYAASILLPAGPKMGLFQDDFPISRSLASPWSTLPALAAWITLAVAAIILRGRAVAFSAGILIFLGAHSMESTILPLEIYFEHRNYLPSVGLLLAVAGTIGWISSRLTMPTLAFKRVSATLGLCILGVMLAGVHARALAWASPEVLVAQSAANRPGSPRVQSMLAAEAMQQGNLQEALARLDRYDTLTDGSELGTTTLWRGIAICRAGAELPPELWSQMQERTPAAPSTFALRAAIVLGEMVEASRCKGVTTTDALAFYQAWTLRLSVARTSHAAWRLRFISARLAATLGNWNLALDLGRTAWEDSGWNTGVGVFVVQVANSKQDWTAARDATERLARSAPEWDYTLNAAVGQFQEHLTQQQKMQ